MMIRTVCGQLQAQATRPFHMTDKRAVHAEPQFLANVVTAVYLCMHECAFQRSYTSTAQQMSHLREPFM